MGINVTMRGQARGIFIEFIFGQYAYKNKVETLKDDVVIDCGAATGDTALYFADKGASKIFAFEFSASNLPIMEENIQLNPQFGKCIQIVPNAVWAKSDEEISYIDNGNSSSVAKKESKYCLKAKTLSIDDLTKREKLTKVSLIKMDIEGSEMSALEGAKDTIMKFKPKLAIAVYHKPDDLIKIPEYIKQLNPNYEFYFDYYTDIGWEAILYAIDKK